MKLSRKILSVSLAVALTLGIAIPGRVNAEGEKKLTIIHTNDVHGRAIGDEEEKDNEKGGEVIGYARLKTFFEKKKAENPNTLLIDAGDATHGTTFVNLSNGENMVKLMNQMGYSVLVPGNHDFNYGYEQLLNLEKVADFDILAANIVKKDSGENALKSNIIKDMNGIKVGIFGLATPETKYKASPKNTEGLEFKDYIEVANAQVKDLKDKGADVIVAVTHLGLDNESEERSELLAEKVKGIDVIIDGHSHTKLEKGKVVGDTLIAQTAGHLKNIGVVEIKLDAANNVAGKTASLVEYADAKKNLALNAEIKRTISSMGKLNEGLLSQKIGKTASKLEGEREFVRTGETNLGNLATDAIKKSVAADVAITNGGGIRASIDGPDITMGDILTTFPFTNFVVKLEVTGADIKAALEHGVDSAPEAAGKFPHVSGMTFKYDSSKPIGQRVGEVLVDGKALDLEKTYSLATNDFMSIGGDGYTMFEGKKKLAEDELLSDVLVKYIKALPNATANYKVEGRILDTKSEAVETEKPSEDSTGKGTVTNISISNHNIVLDGKSVSIPAYNIDGFNYFMIRDIAVALKDSEKPFSVGYDNENKAVVIETGKKYDGEITKELVIGKTAVPSPQKLMIDGKENTDISAYFVNGSNNYFKLADLGKTLGFEVGWDANTKTITLTTVKKAA